jgi:hypothetical protein
MKLTDDQKYSLQDSIDDCKYVPLSVATGRWINDHLHCSLSHSDIESLHKAINDNDNVTKYGVVVHWIESNV